MYSGMQRLMKERARAYKYGLMEADMKDIGSTTRQTGEED
jgi:hypothetical protein